jgi:hypothetical protein
MAKPPASLADAVVALLRQVLSRYPTSAHPAFIGVLDALLLALVTRLLGRTPRRPLRDWYYTPPETPDATPRQLRAARRLRAWIGWILRRCPARGMAPTGSRPAPPCPRRTARAPPPHARMPSRAASRSAATRRFRRR